MTNPPKYGGSIFPQHAKLLIDSAISVEVAKARGYVSVDTKARLDALNFAKVGQRIPGLLIPIRGADGLVKMYQYRPDNPHVDDKGKSRKYEMPVGVRMAVDIPTTIRHQMGDPSVPLWITEGSRKADAAVTAGLCCIALLGVWNWKGTPGKVTLPAWEDIAINGRDIFVAFDSDVMEKDSVAQALDRFGAWLQYRGARVQLVYLPDGENGAKIGLDDFIAAGGTIEQLHSFARRIERATERPGSGKGPSQADVLLDLGAERYILGRSKAGEPFAVAKDGPYLARLLRGGQHSLRAELAAAYRETSRRAASNSALADAMLAIEGQAQAQAAVELHLRTAPDGAGGILLDLGHDDGAIVHITPAGWEITYPTSGPLFRRTEVTGELPTPVRGGNVEMLRSLINVADEYWPLLLGWLVAAYVPDIPHPVGLLIGEQGTAKTTTGKMLVNLIDPSAAPMRAMPRDEQNWGVAASASWVVGIDNLSTIQPWLSDAMCRAVTGEALVSRRLYTNSDLSVLHFRRVLLLTSIDTGSLRGDLADRLLSIELHPIPEERRRTDRELTEAYAAAHPKILGALLDLTAQMLAALPEARRNLTARPRMADFAEILAALDSVRGTSTLRSYLDARDQIAADLIDDDPIASAVRDIAREHGTWTDTPAQLLGLIEARTFAPRPKWWPKTAGTFSGYLTRSTPALRKIGIEVERKKIKGKRLISLTIKGDDPTPESVTPEGESVTPDRESVTPLVTPMPTRWPATDGEMSGWGDEGDALVPPPSVEARKSEGGQGARHADEHANGDGASSSVTLVTLDPRNMGHCARCRRPWLVNGPHATSKLCSDCQKESAA
ncbi:DUF3854 domain-containing protein [Streptosporangium sp. NPDC049248]|uniref:DUF3854 domain-containing protein n=1 Tax=Streptosporangium sp. NPDC049248 TaxID=3155651 RepID=UPI00342AD017